jgi:hypothetical protein
VERKWAQSGVEPPLPELMSDPIVHLLMLRDNITSEDVWSAIRVYWELQRQVQACHPFINDDMTAIQTSPNRPVSPSLRVCVEKVDAMSGPSLNRGLGSTTATHQQTAPMHDKKGHTLRVGVRRSTSR